ncbi:glucuronate isomerase [Paenibacillus hamazuiensis]|uniref:glucuronate isomerase n=1 Tax=Paenibacillus hamazuiensis TaxID=2936508 RepID=UPI00200FCF71|nr:glucuronate isomerase [Paenibacillus hamazuiensis]
MADHKAFVEKTMQMDVLDTHTHLVGDRLPARDFWEIAHYFWLFRELEAGGYPADAAELPEKMRIAAFLEAHRASRNTLMNWVFTNIFKQLYGIDIRDENSVREADEAVRASSAQSGWAQLVADKLNIRGFVVNVPEHAEFHGMRQDALLIPRIDGRLNGWVAAIHQSAEPHAAMEETKRVIGELLQSYKLQGCPGIMTTLPRYEASAHESYTLSAESSRDQILMMLLHAICGEAERNGLFVQLFLGVERSWGSTAVPANDPARILKLTGLFEKYTCPFELVVASEINNLDVVQAAWNHPHVHVGGLWWYNFRASTYRDCMQYRLEALPGIKSSLIASDARCIEWSFGKILLVKRLLGEFLSEKIQAGWLDEDTAEHVAKCWLYQSAADRYGFRP